MKKLLPALFLFLAVTSGSFAAIIALKPAKPIAHWPGDGNARDTVSKNNENAFENSPFRKRPRHCEQK